MSYKNFIQAKLKHQVVSGFEIDDSKLNAQLMPHQKDLVKMALKKGRYCIWADTGLGKAFMGLEWAKHVIDKTSMPVLIVAPLGVAHQISNIEAIKFGYKAKFIEEDADVEKIICVTNYEKLDRFNLSVFGGVVLDESSILKSKDGKTRRFIIDAFSRTPYKLACSATPAPNDHIELGNQCEFVGALTMDEMLAEYFVHDGGKARDWRLKGHAQNKFWEFVGGWAAYISNPSQMGYDGSAYILPELIYHEHKIGKWDDIKSENEFIKHQANGLAEQRQLRNLSMEVRCQKAFEIVESDPSKIWLIWCETNNESDLLSRIIPNSVEVKGSDSDEHKKQSMLAFATGDIPVLITKPKIAGFGMNWQICSNVIYVGLTHSFEQYYQSIRRVYRFGQDKSVNVHIIQHVLEGAIVSNLKRKEQKAQEMNNELSDKLNFSSTYKRNDDYNPLTQMTIPEWLKVA